MDIKIRRYKDSDAKEIYLLNLNEMHYDYPLCDTEKKLRAISESEHDRFFVAEVDNKAVGYVHANDYDVCYYPHMKNIMGIAVDAGYKRCGIGKKLLETVEKWAVETGAEGIRLNSGSERKGAHEFYRHCGYTSNKMQLNFKKTFKED